MPDPLASPENLMLVRARISHFSILVCERAFTGYRLVTVQIQCLLRILREGHDGRREAAAVASGGVAEGFC